MTDEVAEKELPYQPAIEEVVHMAGIEVRKLPVQISPTEQGVLTLLRFHTPTKTYTFKLDDTAINDLVPQLRGTNGSPDILIAQPGQVPGLRR